MGVKLLKYVPDDAFIVRFNHVSADAVQALSFVRWVGPYQADYKIAPRLSATAQSTLLKKSSATTNVSVLISPGATAADITGVRNLFSSVQHQSDLKMGTLLVGELNLDQLQKLAQSDSVLWDRAPRPSANWWTKPLPKSSVAMMATSARQPSRSSLVLTAEA
ncbi:MAG: hypothetical protein WDN00_01870 [Limisphaerales bacterium]